MIQKYRDVLDRIEQDCETAQTYGCECYATQLLDLAVSFYSEQGIKSRCFSYLIATGQMLKYHETTDEELAEAFAPHPKTPQ